MKITNLNGVEHTQRTPFDIEHTEAAGVKATVFSKTLNDLSREQYEKHLHELVGRIDEQSDKLSKRADVKEYERYRSLIRDFLNEVVSNGYEFSRSDSFIGRGRHRVFATVKTIDEKLDALGREVMSGQADQIEVMHKIDDIRGLLLDIML